MKKLLKILLILLIGVVFSFFIYWRLAILECERFTSEYGKEFETIYQENTSIGEIDYLKVLDYSDTFARVYYVSTYPEVGNACGDIVTFTKKDGQWVYNCWEKTVWSKKGNADDYIWPYIR
ncbi:hypothetical protein LJC10_05705 [Selenomonadales bacterium OttesenSCG-928-I06]|nr:hypothetical protein [Selenomonadales bacterium OttesenSCG-928-I06]